MLGINKSRLIHIFDTELLEIEIKKQQSKDNDYFIFSDYQVMDSKLTGLDIIKKCNAQEQSLIVSSYYREHEITNQCIENGLRMLPKNLIMYARYYIKGTDINGILIDDEPINHNNWNYYAHKNDLNILTFYRINDFLNSCKTVPSYIPLYVDSQFSKNVKGEEESLSIYQKGFENLWLCTHADKDSIDLDKHPHLRGFAPKSPVELFSNQVN